MYTGDTSQANALPSALSILKCFSDKGKVVLADYKTWIIRLLAPRQSSILHQNSTRRPGSSLFKRPSLHRIPEVEDRASGLPLIIQISSTNNCINSRLQGRVVPTSVYYELCWGPAFERHLYVDSFLGEHLSKKMSCFFGHRPYRGWGLKPLSVAFEVLSQPLFI